jgi:hypothetical protein
MVERRHSCRVRYSVQFSWSRNCRAPPHALQGHLDLSMYPGRLFVSDILQPQAVNVTLFGWVLDMSGNVCFFLSHKSKSDPFPPYYRRTWRSSIIWPYHFRYLTCQATGFTDFPRIGPISPHNTATTGPFFDTLSVGSDPIISASWHVMQCIFPFFPGIFHFFPVLLPEPAHFL